MNDKNLERTIVVRKQSYRFKELVERISGFSSETVKSFFNQIGLTIPKTLRIHILKLVLEPYVEKTINERQSLADELGYRLSWFTRFSEYQLENLLKFYNDPELDKLYLETLWVYLIDYLLDKKINETDFKNFIEKKEKIKEDLLEYNLNLKDIFFDEPGNIDGLQPNIFRPVLYKSSTLVEIRDIGKKYGVDVPRRLKKNELADIIIEELKDRGEHTEELDLHVRGLSIIMMQRFAKDRNIKASTELKKEEIIEYILANAKETKEAYFLPSDKSIYEQELVEPKKKEEVVEPEEEVVVEKPVEEVKEPIQQTMPSEMQQLLLDEIRRLSEEVRRLHGEINEIKEMEIVIDEPFEEDEDEDGYDQMTYHHHEHHHYHHYDLDEFEDEDVQEEIQEEFVLEEQQPEEVKRSKKDVKTKRSKAWVVLDIFLILILIALVYMLLVQFDIIQPLFPLPF